MKLTFINFFVKHRIIAELLMIIMVLSGLMAIYKINVQLLPPLDFKTITVTYVWPGANAEDIEDAITIPVEKELSDVDHVKKMTSSSRNGYVTFAIRFKDDTNMNDAFEAIRQKINQVKELPRDAENPIIERVPHQQTIARLILSTADSLDNLRFYAEKIKAQLLEAGIPKINIIGMPEREINVAIHSHHLVQYGLTLQQIAMKISALSLNQPIGDLNTTEGGKVLRIQNEARDIDSLKHLPIITDNKGRVIYLGDIASIFFTSQYNEARAYSNGLPAIELELVGMTKTNTIESAKILQHWFNYERNKLPPSITIDTYYQYWLIIKERISLLIHNGLSGFIFILAVLFLTLNFRVAAWVTLGIPVSILASIAVLYMLGGSINMVSLFAVVMTLGIIVDDNIVIGEEVFSLLQEGKPIEFAAPYGAKRMFTSIIAASLTTIAAFFPLLFIRNEIGDILIDIPIAVICIIIASLVECFLILPGHLHTSFKNATLKESFSTKYFEHFRETYFKSAVRYTLQRPWSVILITIALFIISISLVLTHRVNFTFFPSPENAIVVSETTFVAGTPENERVTFIHTLDNALKKTEQQFKNKDKPNEKRLTNASVGYFNYSEPESTGEIANTSDNTIGFNFELVSQNERSFSTNDFIEGWKKNITLPAGITKFSVLQKRFSPPGKDIDIRIDGLDHATLKIISTKVQAYLNALPGVYSVQDNLPMGKEQLLLSPTEKALALGINTSMISRQLMAAFTGYLTQIHYKNGEEIEVRVKLATSEAKQSDILNYYPIITPDRKVIPLKDLVTIKKGHGFASIPHTAGERVINITAQVDHEQNNASLIIASLNKDVLEPLQKHYAFHYTFVGKAEEQRDSFADMEIGLAIGLILIYFILVWAFHSFGWPIIVIITVPFGITGAIFGHAIMGMDLTMLSFFGLFGLAGILINDAIILVNRYRELCNNTANHYDAILEATCQRMRAIVLTSVTTIVGLIPLLFETSLQAKFLIPMAVSVAFGLAFSTFLLLFVLPCMLCIYESWRT